VRRTLPLRCTSPGLPLGRFRNRMPTERRRLRMTCAVSASIRTCGQYSHSQQREGVNEEQNRNTQQFPRPPKLTDPLCAESRGHMEWISVRDHLPEQGRVEVLVTNGSAVAPAWWVKGTFEAFCEAGRRLKWVTHWRRFPDPPTLGHPVQNQLRE
jgi:hypothetical protein